MSFILLTELFEEPSSFAPTVCPNTDVEGNKKTGLGLNKFSLRNIVLNKNNVVLLREDRITQELHENDELTLGLRKDQAFTRIYLSCSEISNCHTKKLFCSRVPIQQNSLKPHLVGILSL